MASRHIHLMQAAGTVAHQLVIASEIVEMQRDESIAGPVLKISVESRAGTQRRTARACDVSYGVRECGAGSASQPGGRMAGIRWNVYIKNTAAAGHAPGSSCGRADTPRTVRSGIRAPFKALQIAPSIMKRFEILVAVYQLIQPLCFVKLDAIVSQGRRQSLAARRPDHQSVPSLSPPMGIGPPMNPVPSYGAALLLVCRA